MAKIKFELPEEAESVSFEVEGRNIIVTYEPKKVYKPWRAERGTYYYFINNKCEIQCAVDIGDKLDDKFFEIGNYYRTPELAEAARVFVLQAYKHKHD